LRAIVVCLVISIGWWSRWLSSN